MDNLSKVIGDTIDELMSFHAIDYSLMARIAAVGPFDPRGPLNEAWVEARKFSLGSLMKNVRVAPESNNYPRALQRGTGPRSVYRVPM